MPQRVFLLEGLKELKESMGSLQVKLLCVKANDNKDALKIALQLCEGACEVVLDAAYLRGDREFEEQLNHMLIERCRKLTRIEGNVSVPINVSSFAFFFLSASLFFFLCQSTALSLPVLKKSVKNSKICFIFPHL